MTMNPKTATQLAIDKSQEARDQNLNALAPSIQAGQVGLDRATDRGIWDVAVNTWENANSANPNINQTFNQGQITPTVDPSKYQWGGPNGISSQISSAGGSQAMYQNAVGPDSVNQKFTSGQVALPGEVNYQSILSDPMYQFERDQAMEMQNRNLARQGMLNSRYGADASADTGMRAALAARDRLYQQGLDKYQMGAGNAERLFGSQNASANLGLANNRNLLDLALANARGGLDASQTNAQTSLQASIANQGNDQWGIAQQMAADQANYNQQADNWNRGFAADQATYGVNSDNFNRANSQNQYQLNSLLDGVQMYNQNNQALINNGQNALSTATRLNTGNAQDYGAYQTGLSNVNEASRLADDVNRNNLITSGINAAGNIGSSIISNW